MITGFSLVLLLLIFFMRNPHQYERVLKKQILGVNHLTAEEISKQDLLRTVVLGTLHMCWPLT